MNINNYNLKDITWDTFIEDYKFVHNRLYKNIDINTDSISSIQSIWEVHLNRVTRLFNTVLEYYYNKGAKLPSNLEDIYPWIYCELNLNRTTIHDIAIKLRDCRNFEEYKKFVETDGLDFICDLIHKRTLKRVMDKNLMHAYHNKITYLLSLTLFPMYLNKGVLPSELDDIISNEFRYDYIDYGYPLFECPIMSKALLSEFSYSINEYIDNEVSKNNKFPKDAEMNVEFHKVLITGTMTNLSRYKDRYDVTKIICDKILNYFDRFTMVATGYIDEIIEDLSGTVEIDTNGFLNNLIPTVKSCETREEMVERVVNLENEYLLQEEILHKVIDRSEDIFQIIGAYVLSLANLGTKIKSSKGINISYRSINSSDKKDILNTCEHLFEFKDFLLEYLLQATFNLTVHADDNLNEYIAEVINKHCDMLNINDFDNDENVIETALAKDLEIKFRDKYRDLNAIAEQNGFNKIRQKGDHGIFRRNDGSTIVIPQGRKIGKGLSLKIQKDIKCV